MEQKIEDQSNLEIYKGYTDMQAKYGTVVIPEFQAKYGVIIPEHHLPGILVPPVDGNPPDAFNTEEIDTILASMEDNISQLQAQIDKIRNTWENAKASAGPEKAASTDVNRMDGKVQKAVSALELLRGTYEYSKEYLSLREKDKSELDDMMKQPQEEQVVAEEKTM